MILEIKISLKVRFNKCEIRVAVNIKIEYLTEYYIGCFHIYIIRALTSNHGVEWISYDDRLCEEMRV